MADRDSKLARLFEEIAAILRGGDTKSDEEPKKGKVGYSFDVAPYGKNKGELWVKHSTDELLWWVERFEEELADPARTKWKKNTQRQLEAVRAILKERKAVHAGTDDADE